MNKAARNRILQDFRNGAVRILVSCRCLDEGIDVPDADVGIVMSCTSVERQRVQRLGRIIRSSKEKTAACLYYLYISESSEDSAYLPGAEGYPCFSLKYYTAEDAFSNDLYEYAAFELMHSAGINGFKDERLKELRRCLNEGHICPDYLQSEAVQKEYARRAGNKHERNYWNVMRAVGKEFQTC